MTAALELRALAKTYRAGVPGCLASARALERVDLRVAPGELVGVVGDEGAGKTTLLLCAAGLLRPDRGEVLWLGTRERGAGGAPASVAFVPARPRFHARLTAREALADGTADRAEHDPTRADAAASALERVGLPGLADVPVAWLPGDARRRLALARALVVVPRLLLLDEPLFAIGADAGRRVGALLGRFVSDGGAVLLTARERAPLAAVATRLLALRDGRLDDEARASLARRATRARPLGRRVAEPRDRA